MSGLLLEILSEEIPSRFHNEVSAQLETIIGKEFQKHALGVRGLNISVSPRRIVLEVAEIKQGVVETKKGPKVDAPKSAIEGFMKSCGVSLEKLEIKDVSGVQYYFSPYDPQNIDITETLCKTIERALTQISWPKSMFWNESKIRWVRPIRNIMAIFGGAILPLEFMGLKANNHTYGHKLMSPGAFEVKNSSQYHEQLLSRYVVISSEQRRKIIKDQVSVIEKSLGVEAIKDESLLNDIIGLVEYPVVKYGEINKRFLSLPKEVVVKIMSAHQRFIALQNKDGSLAPYFITVLNVDFHDSEKSIIAGNEKVLSARLYDGKFFFDEDNNVSLESRVKDLKQVVFHDKLGNLLGKVERIEKISSFLSGFSDADRTVLVRAVLLSKADLTTLMVNEFPELQGIVGKYYAQHEGEHDEVIKAIDEHYFPKGKDGECPSSIYGSLISIADKIDTIVGLFLAQEIPTSSKDPYALRRCALGVLRIICDSSLNINLKDLIKHSSSFYDISCNDHTLNQILEFIYERFRFWLKINSRDDFVSAALYSRSGFILREYNVLRLLEKLHHNQQELFFTFKRVTNIVETNNTEIVEINKGFLTIDEERLLKQVEVLEAKIESFYGYNNDTDLIAVLVDIEKIVGNLFTNTMIIDKNLEIRKHRISVLKMLYSQFQKIADFSLIDL